MYTEYNCHDIKFYSCIQVDTPPLVFDTLKKFGHSEFRPGQEEAIMNILSGKRIKFHAETVAT